MSSYLRRVWWIMLLMFVATPLRAQRLDPDRRWDRDQWEHAAMGAAIDLALRPALKPPLNRPLPRIAMTCLIGAAYEGLQLYETRGRRGEGYGFGLLDLAADCAGAAVMEAVTRALWKDR